MACECAVEAFPSLQVPIPGAFSKQIDCGSNSKMNRLEDYTTEIDAVAEEARSRAVRNRSSTAGQFWSVC